VKQGPEKWLSSHNQAKGEPIAPAGMRATNTPRMRKSEGKGRIPRKPNKSWKRRKPRRVPKCNKSKDQATGRVRGGSTESSARGRCTEAAKPCEAKRDRRNALHQSRRDAPCCGPRRAQKTNFATRCGENQPQQN